MSTSKKVFFIIIGLPRQGKDAFAEALSVMTKGQVGACSDSIYQYWAEHNKALLDKASPGNDTPTSTLEGWLRGIPKESARPMLIAIGDYLCRQDPISLVRMQFEKGVRILTGIRRKEELAAAKAFVTEKGLRPMVVWVHRVGFVSPKDNTTVTEDLADWAIHAEEGANRHFPDAANRITKASLVPGLSSCMYLTEAQK